MAMPNLSARPPRSGDQAQSRKDAAINRVALLDAAERVLSREGPRATLETIAKEAGLGIGTLYRNFADRTELFAEVTHRAYELVASFAAEAEHSPGDPLGALSLFLARCVEHRDRLILPLHGGPAPLPGQIDPLGAVISASLETVLERGRADGSIRPDASATDVVVTGAMLAAARLPPSEWERVAQRHAALFLDGLRASGGTSKLPPPLTRSELNSALTKPE
jgi:AcrR family transcriptional regulator